MKLVESSDGTISVVELDPTKWYWIVMDADAMDLQGVQKLRESFGRDGLIIVKRPGREIQFVESTDRVVGVEEVSDARL